MVVKIGVLSTIILDGIDIKWSVVESQFISAPSTVIIFLSKQSNATEFSLYTGKIIPPIRSLELIGRVAAFILLSVKKSILICGRLILLNTKVVFWI